jgi:hypothetical protein
MMTRSQNTEADTQVGPGTWLATDVVDYQNLMLETSLFDIY